MAHPIPPLSIILADLAATSRLGKSLGEKLFPNSVVALIGNLGAGKTHLTRAIAIGLGVSNERLVTSPTFVLIQEYPARLPIYHFDAYRLAGVQSFLDLGIEEYYSSEGVCLIEWADRVTEALPEEYLEIRLEAISETARRCEITPIGPSYFDIVAKLRP